MAMVGNVRARSPDRNRQLGFNLIEMMMVVTVGSMMLMAGVPSFASYLANQRVSTASRDLLQDLIEARTESARTGFRARLMPKSGSDWAAGWDVVRNAGLTEDAVVYLDDTPISAGKIEIAACINGAGAAPRIEFDAMGELATPSDGARITIVATVGNVRAAREVVVAPSGRAETVRISGEDADLACG